MMFETVIVHKYRKTHSKWLPGPPICARNINHASQLLSQYEIIPVVPPEQEPKPKRRKSLT